MKKWNGNGKKELDFLKVETRELRDKVEKLENYSHRTNIRLYNIKESKEENLEDLLVQVMNKYLSPWNWLLTDRNFESLHRLGKPLKDQTCVGIARFSSYKDKKPLLSVKKQIKLHEGIGISDDYSSAIEEKRKQLFPICKAIRQHKLKETGLTTNVYLKMDKLMVDGKQYTVENIDSLPVKYKLENLFTPSGQGITAFFTRNSPLSNHYKCQFVLEGEKYNCMEQYIMSAKAALFEDQQSVLNICKAEDPVQQKRLGSKIRNFRHDVWNNRVEEILLKGLVAKFEQNPDLAEFLLNTYNNTIIEANPNDRLFGVGLSLGHADIWDRDRWQGSNLQGKALEKVQKTLCNK